MLSGAHKMHLLPEDDLISLNFYYRNKLKKSLTYLIYCGYFDKIRSLIESSAHAGKQATTSKQYEGGTEEAGINYYNNTYFYPSSSSGAVIEKIDINETDEWWIDLPSSITKKSLNQKLYRPLTTAYLTNKESMQTPNGATSNSLRFSLNNLEATAKEKPSSAPAPVSRTRGRTPLMLCSMIEDNSWSYSIAQNLIEKGADLGLKDSNGYNALMYASLYERTNILELFLNAPGDYNILSKDLYGNTVFHLASLGKCQKNCGILHEIANKFGVDPFIQVEKNFFGHMPYDICKLNNHDYCLRTLYRSVNFKKGILATSSRLRQVKPQRIVQKVQINLENKLPVPTTLVVKEDKLG